uniref:Uncharacterized protein n=1 Tax=Poecilia mexicana TaxID=48701 RepID=A0A3B3YSR9_9TELE
MLLRDLMPFTLSFWPFFIAHCLLSQLSLSCKVSIGEIQRSCSRTVAEKVGEQCQVACHCRRYPPLPPPPPPPPPPRLLGTTVAEPMVPLLRPWWMEVDVIVLGTVSCASVVFLLSAIIICYKAIKRLWHNKYTISSKFNAVLDCNGHLFTQTKHMSLFRMRKL